MVNFIQPLATIRHKRVLNQTHSQFWHTQSSVYSGIFKHTQAYWALLSHIHTYWSIFKAYSGTFSILCNPIELYGNPHIFTTLPYSEPLHLQLEVYWTPCGTLTRHIPNFIIIRTVYPSIIQPYIQAY